MERRMLEMTQSLSTTDMCSAFRNTRDPASAPKSTPDKAPSQVPVRRSCSDPVRGVPVTFTLVQPHASAKASAPKAIAGRLNSQFHCMVDCLPDQETGDRGSRVGI